MANPGNDEPMPAEVTKNFNAFRGFKKMFNVSYMDIAL